VRAGTAAHLRIATDDASPPWRVRVRPRAGATVCAA
jgi:hypothetical protein